MTEYSFDVSVTVDSDLDEDSVASRILEILTTEDMAANIFKGGTLNIHQTKFHNHSRRMWTEEMCRNMINLVVLHMCVSRGGQMSLPVAEMFKSSEKANNLSMAVSDDDKTLVICAVPSQ